MQLHFVKINPSGNTTVLILDPLPREIYPLVAARSMKVECLAAEQVGFIESSTNSEALARLQMMGGEFCWNASLGFAAWLTKQKYSGILFQKESKSWIVPIEVSGHNGVLNAVVSKGSSGEQFNVEAPMPVPLWIRWCHLKGIVSDIAIVCFQGIVHVIVWDITPSEEQVTKIKNFITHELGNFECLGIMFFNENDLYLTPVVYVKRVNSLVWESSCGSGTVAVAAALADKKQKSVDSLYLAQPGGVIKVSTKWNGNVTEAKISEKVNFEAEGIVYLGDII